ncbi:MAG: nucleoside triphosphate pyrophosphohydrolase [Bacteroidales bacterium]|jgi:XTP/dITP diphosphohydrolase|nr:nucleoside triphosphate pyrophosphohydrolase [Bacteroidales bacterium]
MTQNNNEKALIAFNRLLNIMTELRKKCPWDKKQTFESLKTNTIEEVYELAQAIDNKDMDSLKKEVGDLLLHVVFYAEIASEINAFDVCQVINSLCEKLIRRHPHIYGDIKANSAKEVKDNWEQIKKTREGQKSILSGVPSALPALIKAYRVQEKASGVGFDWDNVQQVWDKVEEEIGEMKAELAKGNKEKAFAEFGDVMFALINYARFIDVNPENALEYTNKKFIDRFNYIEERVNEMHMNLREMTLSEINKLWDEAKEHEK